MPNHKYKTLFKGLIIALALGIVLAILPGTVFAHAQYLHSNPPTNSSFPSGNPPTQVQVWFSEGIEPKFSSLGVYDKSGTRVDTNQLRFFQADDTTMAVSLPPNLPDGAYTVSYQNVSREDGHAVKGSFSFVVGAGALPATAESILDGVSSNDMDANPWGVPLRWLNYIAMSAVVGSLVFLLLVWQPTVQKLSSKVGAELKESSTKLYNLAYKFLGWSLGLLFIGWIAFLVFQATVVGNVYPWQIFENNTLGNLLLSSRFGNIWLVRLDLILVAFLLWAFARGSGRVKIPGMKRANLVPETESSVIVADEGNRPLRGWILWVILLLGAGIMLTTSLNSHAVATRYPLLLVPNDMLHLLSTGFWIGGLFFMVLGLPVALRALVPGTGDRTRLLAALIPQFSFVAILSVAFLLISGTIQAAVQLGSLDGFFSSGYGIALFIKLCFSAPLLLIGAYNLLNVSPRMKKFARRKGDGEGAAGSLEAGSLQRFFRRSVMIEAGLALVLLVWVALLTSFGPAFSGYEFL